MLIVNAVPLPDAGFVSAIRTTLASLPDLGQILIGASFVLIAAASRFNTPATNRCSTTALRYFLAASSYLLFEISLYLGLIYLAHMYASTRQALGSEAGFFEPLLSLKSAAPFAALLLTVLLPKVPLLADADRWVLERLQRMGAIPFEARRLAAELRRSHFTVPAQLRDKVAERLRTLGFKAEDIHFQESPALEHMVVKISALMIQLEEWGTNRRFDGFLTRYRAEFETLKTIYGRVASSFKLLRGFGQEGPDRRSDRLFLHVQSDIDQRSADLLGEIYYFASRGLLQCCTTYGARAAELRSLGFDSRTIALKPKVTLDQLISLFLAIEGAMMASLVMLAHEHVPLTGEHLGLITMVSTMYTVAVLCAVYPKERWRFARRRELTRPASYYLAAALLATAASLVIRLAFQLMIYHAPHEAWQHFHLSSPWSLCAFVAAFMVAWMIDDAPGARLSRQRLRLVEGLAGGGILMLSSYIALQWVAGVAHSDPALLKIYSDQTPSLALGLSTVIGFGIGWLIPTWYRTASLEGNPSTVVMAGGPAAEVAG